MSVFSRRFSKTAVFSRFLKLAISMSNFMSKIYNKEFAPGVGVWYVKGNHHASSKLYMWNLEIKSKIGGIYM